MRPARLWARLLGVERVVVEQVAFDEDAEDAEAIVVAVRPARAPSAAAGCAGGAAPASIKARGGGAGGRWTLAWCAPGWKRTPQGAPGTLGRSTLRRGWRCTAPSRRSGSCCGCLAHGRADRGAGGRRRRAGQGSVRGLTRIGIDEISYKKGHRYLTVVVDHDAGRLLWAAPGHDAATLGRFFDASASSAAPRSGWSVPMPRSGSRPWWPRAARTRCCAWTRSMS